MVQIVYCDPGRRTGWDSVTHMVRLAGELFETEPVILGLKDLKPSLGRTLATLLARRRGPVTCLLVCPAPIALNLLLALDRWRTRFGQVNAWIIDSFWVESIPWFARHTRAIDRFFVTNVEDVEEWTRRTRTPTAWLPWGTDALRLGSANPERTIDLLRWGRQPASWERDDETGAACHNLGLRFRGRPAGMDDPSDNERLVMHAISMCKFTLSFSNRVSPAIYTHPTREYVTARWVDAIAAGAIVAGIPPKTLTARRLIPADALLDLGTVERDVGLSVIASAARVWRPSQAEANHRFALEHLDWRWRFKTLAETLGEAPRRLNAEIALLQDAIASRQSRGVGA